MRVLAVGSMYPPHALGGYEVTWQSSVEHLRERGHEVEVLTTWFRVREAAGHRDPTWVHRDLGWYWHDHDFPRLSARERIRLERRNARVFDDRLLRFKPDVVCWWAMGGMSLSLIEQARRAGLPAVGVVGDEWMVYGPQRDGWLGPLRGGRARRLAGAAGALTRVPTDLDLGAAARWLFVSEGVRDSALSAWELPDTAIAHPGVDADLFRPSPPGPWGWRLAVVGRLDPRKGVDAAVRALGRLPAEASLTVTGSGDAAYRRQLDDVAREAGVTERVSYRTLPHDRVAEAYAEADAVLFPVLWDEPWGLVPLEAMAVGRPVVTSGRGGQAAYLRDGDNAMVREPEPDALATAVVDLAGSSELRERLTAGGARTAADHTAAAYDLAIETALLEVVG